MYSRPFPSRLYANDSFKENSREEFEAFVETLRRSCFVELENHKCQIFYSKDVTGYCGRNVNHEVNQVVSLCQEFFTNFGKRSFYYAPINVMSHYPRYELRWGEVGICIPENYNSPPTGEVLAVQTPTYPDISPSSETWGKWG